jgi:hypothetical protein
VPRDIVSVLVGHTSPITTAEYDHARALYFRQFADRLDFGITIPAGTNRVPEEKEGEAESV